MATADQIRLTTPTLADIPAILAVVAATFSGDEFYKLALPGHQTHPGDYRRHISRNLRTRFATPGFKFQVAHDHSATPPRMVGFSCIKLDGECPTAAEWNGRTADGRSLFGARVERKLIELEEWYERLVFGSRTVDWNFRKDNAVLERAFDGMPAVLRQRALVVLPECQGRGIGSKLMEWALDWGRKENLPFALNASERGRGMYQKAGFKVVGVDVVRGLQVPNMVWEPEQSKGKWLEETNDPMVPWRVKANANDTKIVMEAADVPVADVGA